MSPLPHAQIVRNAAQTSSHQLLQTLQRMIVWSVGYHLIAVAFLVQTAAASVEKLSKSRSGRVVTTDEGDSRSATVMFGTAGGKTALARIKLLLPCLPKQSPTNDAGQHNSRHISLNMFRQGTVTEAELTQTGISVDLFSMTRSSSQPPLPVKARTIITSPDPCFDGRNGMEDEEVGAFDVARRGTLTRRLKRDDCACGGCKKVQLRFIPKPKVQKVPKAVDVNLVLRLNPSLQPRENYPGPITTATLSVYPPSSAEQTPISPATSGLITPSPSHHNDVLCWTPTSPTSQRPPTATAWWWDRADGMTVRTSRDDSVIDYPSLMRSKAAHGEKSVMSKTSRLQMIKRRSIARWGDEELGEVERVPSLPLMLPGPRFSVMFDGSKDGNRRWSGSFLEKKSEQKPNERSLIVMGCSYTHPRRPAPRAEFPMPVHVFHRTVKRTLASTSRTPSPVAPLEPYSPPPRPSTPPPPSECDGGEPTTPPPARDDVQPTTPQKEAPSKLQIPTIHAASSTLVTPSTLWGDAATTLATPTPTRFAFDFSDLVVGKVRGGDDVTESGSTLDDRSPSFWASSVKSTVTTVDGEEVLDETEGNERRWGTYHGWFAPVITWKSGDKRPYWAEAWYNERR
ncbi:hypothetical protein HDU67_005549 [Dinochytrium kinnereticum]|nr:hypothetical protein HDU67_005549 [Dinochytrium kinnereticum]